MDLIMSGKQYHTDYSIVYSCQYHVNFCPKYRRNILVGGVEKRLKELILEKQDKYGYQVIEMEIISDHAHILLDVDPRVWVNKVVGQIKGSTSHELQKKYPHLRKRIQTL